MRAGGLLMVLALGGYVIRELRIESNRNAGAKP
jgi:hypothetical protein